MFSFHCGNSTIDNGLLLKAAKANCTNQLPMSREVLAYTEQYWFMEDVIHDF